MGDVLVKEAQQTEQQLQRVIQSLLFQKTLTEMLLANWQKVQKEKAKETTEKEENQEEQPNQKEPKSPIEPSEHSGEPSRQDSVKIWEGERLVYGSDGDSLINDLTVTELEKLAKIQGSAVGTVVEGAAHRKIAINEQIIIETDEKGTVIKNDLVLPHELKSPEVPQEITVVSEENWVRPKTGLEAAEVGLQALGENNPVGDLLSATLEEIETIKQQNTAMQAQLSQVIEKNNSDPANGKWLENIRESVTAKISRWQTNQLHQDLASTVRELFNQQTEPGANNYEMEGYRITRLGKTYSLNEPEGNPLIQFQTTATGGIKLVNDVQLTEPQVQDLMRLKEELKLHQKPTGNFAVFGAGEASRFERINRLTTALTNYAKQQGQTVEIRGEKYHWLARPNGDVRIDSLSKGTLLFQNGGKRINRLSERDLAFFEQVLPTLEQHQSRVPTPDLPPNLTKSGQVIPLQPYQAKKPEMEL
jgi:hypothetical protein